MIKSGLKKIRPYHRDLSLIHTLIKYGATPELTSLPAIFSIYDGRSIPNQNQLDTRFIPAVRPLPEGCTAETITFDAGIQDGATYPPDDFYFATPPGTDNVGRDARVALQTAINRGFKLPDGTIGAKRTAYFNCYGVGKIDDFDAARIGLWINQTEKRGVLAGTWWYAEYEQVGKDGILPLPSFNTSIASLHFHLITGWKTIGLDQYLEDISWQGEDYANAGIDYISREQYNALMAQPYTGAFTETKLQGMTPVPIGMQAYVDHVVYALTQFISNLYQNYGKFFSTK